MNVFEKILVEIKKVKEDYAHGEHSPLYTMGDCSMAAASGSVQAKGGIA